MSVEESPSSDWSFGTVLCYGSCKNLRGGSLSAAGKRGMVQL